MARVVTRPAVALLIKGVVLQHPLSSNLVLDLIVWDRWVDCSSPNARTVCKSQVVVITHKAVVLPRHDLHRQMNRASAVRGFIYKG